MTAVLLGALAAGSVALRMLRGTWDASRGVRPRWRERLAGVRLAVVGFSAGHPGRLWRAFALDLVFHLLAVLEVFLTLQWLLGDRSPTLAQAIAFEALNRVITVVFKFVPFRIGVDEALSGAAAPMLAFSPAAGVSARGCAEGEELVLERRRAGDHRRPPDQSRLRVSPTSSHRIEFSAEAETTRVTDRR